MGFTLYDGIWMYVGGVNLYDDKFKIYMRLVHKKINICDEITVTSSEFTLCNI